MKLVETSKNFNLTLNSNVINDRCETTNQRTLKFRSFPFILILSSFFAFLPPFFDEIILRKIFSSSRVHVVVFRCMMLSRSFIVFSKFQLLCLTHSIFIFGILCEVKKSQNFIFLYPNNMRIFQFFENFVQVSRVF
jgi:hypothetical protein